MEAYQRLYVRLHRLVMARKPGELETPEFAAIRREMDRLPGTSDEKRAWGEAAGWPLYRAEVYG